MYSRLQYYTFCSIPWIITKSLYFTYNNYNLLTKVILSAGLYKPNSFFTQHSLMLANLSSQPAEISYQSHGKRHRRTVSAHNQITNKMLLPIIDKIVHEVIPIASDFKTPKWYKNKKTKAYTLRIRHKFLTYDNFDNLTTATMFDTYRGVYLPLSIHIVVNKNHSQSYNEMCLRLYRLPINIYKKRYRPAFDDAISFNQ